MKNIVKTPIITKVSDGLKKKQEKINSGEKDSNWWSLSNGQRREIERKLFQSQGNICCYCECEIDKKNKHIEHFHERNDKPTKIYDYENMLLSCEGDKNAELEKIDGINNAKLKRKENISCGHNKSESYHNNEKTNYDLLLNPIDVETSKLFLYTDLGEVEPSNDCSKLEVEKAKYTIKRLNLDCEKLNIRRENQILFFMKEINNLSNEEQEIIVKKILDLSKREITPYYSTIKDNFGYIINN